MRSRGATGILGVAAGAGTGAGMGAGAGAGSGSGAVARGAKDGGGRGALDSSSVSEPSILMMDFVEEWTSRAASLVKEFEGDSFKVES